MKKKKHGHMTKREISMLCRDTKKDELMEEHETCYLALEKNREVEMIFPSAGSIFFLLAGRKNTYSLRCDTKTFKFV